MSNVSFMLIKLFNAFFIFGLIGVMALIPTGLLIVAVVENSHSSNLSLTLFFIAVPISSGLAGTLLSPILLSNQKIRKWVAALIPILSAMLIGPIAYILALLAQFETTPYFGLGVGIGFFSIAVLPIYLLVLLPLSLLGGKLYFEVALTHRSSGTS